jgi:hypothetical protein
VQSWRFKCGTPSGARSKGLVMDDLACLGSASYNEVSRASTYPILQVDLYLCCSCLDNPSKVADVLFIIFFEPGCWRHLSPIPMSTESRFLYIGSVHAYSWAARERTHSFGAFEFSQLPKSSISDINHTTLSKINKLLTRSWNFLGFPDSPHWVFQDPIRLSAICERPLLNYSA